MCTSTRRRQTNLAAFLIRLLSDILTLCIYCRVHCFYKNFYITLETLEEQSQFRKLVYVQAFKSKKSHIFHGSRTRCAHDSIIYSVKNWRLYYTPRKKHTQLVKIVFIAKSNVQQQTHYIDAYQSCRGRCSSPAVPLDHPIGTSTMTRRQCWIWRIFPHVYIHANFVPNTNTTRRRRRRRYTTAVLHFYPLRIVSHSLERARDDDDDVWCAPRRRAVECYILFFFALGIYILYTVCYAVLESVVCCIYTLPKLVNEGCYIICVLFFFLGDDFIALWRT